MLFPIENEVRQVKSLNGIWKFKKEDYFEQGIIEKWYEKPLEDSMEMPVPASYNDITTDRTIRDHVGWVWYERIFYIPSDWLDKRLVLRFGSVTHHAVAYINGKEFTRHKGGFLPFEAELNEYINPGQNRVTVAVSNMLDNTCLPFGAIHDATPESYVTGDKIQEIHFDFFNYSGIHRPVKIYTTPKAYIKDITVVTDIADKDGVIDYEVQIEGAAEAVCVTLIDEAGVVVSEKHERSGRITVKDAHFWDVRKAYLYQLDIRIDEDHYTLPVGIRTIQVTEKQLLLNGKPIYLKGFGKHEDSDIRGKGLDEALNVRDFELLKWIGANSFRTSHYPYSEEIMQMADRQGFLVIDEVPAVGMRAIGFEIGNITDDTLKHHKDVLSELYQRDKNHPCVIMWSVANECAAIYEEAIGYFTEVANHIRSLDSTRPVVHVTAEQLRDDKVTHLFDAVCINRYYSWYEDLAKLDSIYPKLTTSLRAWHERFRKPIIVTEYGTDAIAGLHKLPEVIFSEEYQIEYYKENNRAIDDCDFVVGEHLWAFADFMTDFNLKRFDGNKKGIFTRQRQPKSVAFAIKKRWHEIP